MNALTFNVTDKTPAGRRFPEDFVGAEKDAQIIGFWRASFGGPYLRPDFVLVANLVRDSNPAIPMLFEVAHGRHPRRMAEGQTALLSFQGLVAGLPA